MPLPQRKSPRLKDYDYASSGGYFVTICTYERKCVFGEIANQQMELNVFGTIVHEQWKQTGILRDNVQLDAFVVMPNHVHGIILITSTNNNLRDMMHHVPTPRKFSKPIANSLSAIVGSFKAAVTRQIRRLPETPDHPIWQSRYHDHIIRSLPDLNRIRAYVRANPAG